MDVLGGMVTGAAVAVTYQRLRERHEHLPDLEGPLRAGGDVVATAVDTTGRLGARAWREAEATGERLVDTPPVRFAVGAVAGVVDTATKLIGTVTSRLPGIGSDKSEGEKATTTPTVVASATKFHLADCRYGKHGRRVTRDEALADALTACRVCRP